MRNEAPPGDQPIEDTELDSLLGALCERHSFDFRRYQRASLNRRIADTLQREKIDTVGQLEARMLVDEALALRLIRSIAVNYSELFRDPEVFSLLRHSVLPVLATHPFLRIWSAGVASGEEAYSMAILLTELGLYDRCRIYGTDIVESSLQEARRGIYHISKMRQYTNNYLAAGGSNEFSKYYTARFGYAALADTLKTRITYANHNLIRDASFNVFHLVLCRNVTIYLDETLTRKVHRLIYDSLDVQGVLVLGNSESLRTSPFAERFEPLDRTLPVYRKVA